MLVGSKYRGVMYQKDWEVLDNLWPAIVSAQKSEKQSIVQLYASVADGLRYLDAIALSHTVCIPFDT